MNPFFVLLIIQYSCTDSLKRSQLLVGAHNNQTIADINLLFPGRIGEQTASLIIMGTNEQLTSLEAVCAGVINDE